MADKCFICDKPLSDCDSVNVVRGLNSLKAASTARNDGNISYLNTLSSVNVHVECRKVYISKNSIAAFKRRLEEDGSSTSSSSPCRPRVDDFDFSKSCIFCGQSANETAERKKEEKYRRIIRKVSTSDFRDNVIKRAEDRGDFQGKLVKERLLQQNNLIAAEARYHEICYSNFLRRVPSAEEDLRQRNVTNSMREIFIYIENNDDSQFTLQELRNIPTDHVPDDKTILTKLRERYSSDIIITSKPRSFTIISFRDTQNNVLSKAWYDNKKRSPHEERLRVVAAAAAIIREDIRSLIVECKSYPPPSSMLDNVNEEIPETLLHFLHEVILKNRKGRTDHLKTKCTAISHAIMATMRQRSFSSQLLLGLSVLLHRRYGSKRLIDILYSLGFCASYSDTVTYELSTVYHPQPRVLSLESSTLVQYVGDNADINTNTLDGHNTLHVMGMIKIVTPKNAVISDERMEKCTNKPTARELAAVSHVPLLIYEKPIIPGFSTIEVDNLIDVELLTNQKLNAIDFLWLYGKWRNIYPLPGWNGYLEQLTRNNAFSTSQIMFLPFIDNPASNLNTIYTTLQCAINIAKTHDQKTCVITFDQPLYSKAREMVAASDDNSDLSRVIVRLGGFHTIMSFLGCIGYIMDGSGIKEALSTIYAPNSVDKLLDGHAYSRSIRGHTLLRLALSTLIFEDMKLQSDALDSLIEETATRNVRYYDVEQCARNSNLLIDQFQNKLQELKAEGPTAQLWIQYFEMVSIAVDFIRAERLGLFEEHLNSVRRMLPYFHASGRFLYAKSAHLYLQDMMKLEETMDQQTFENFKNGFFTVRRTDKFNSGTWTDMVIEQSLMKCMKTEGGLSRGRSTQESVLCKWVYGMYATNTICDLVEKFCNVSLDSAEQHIDARESRVKRDNTDVRKLLDWFALHNPFPQTKQVVSIASGIVGNDQINCHRARDIGIESMVKINGLKFNEVKLKRIDKVLSISAINKSIKINDCKVSVDPLLLFQRITVNKKFESNLKEYLQYELSPYPTSLFDNTGMRKTTKSKLYNNMVSVDIELNEDDIIYVIDGGSLLHRVVWSKDDTFSMILDKYVKYLQQHYRSNIIVVFDGYSDYSKNIKAMEQLRRSAVLSSSHEISFQEAMIVPISQEKFLSNRLNKKTFIAMLIEKLESQNIATKQARDDADVLIIETAIEESEKDKTVVIVGEDIDLLIILIGRTLTNQKQIFFKKIGKGNIQTQIFSSKSFDKYPRCKKNILFLHAFTGCDTTSALYRKGKLSILKMFEKNFNLEECAQIFQQENCHPEVLFENGIRFFLEMYNAPKTEESIDNLRYVQFIKSTKLNKPVQLSSLPPTSAAARQHINRVYYQIQTWLGNDLEPQEWGWTLENEFLQPMTTLLPPAPEELLNTIFCNCKKGCGSNCGCRKVGLRCSSICGQCSGEACLNAALRPSDVDEDIEYVPEVIENIQSHITDDKDDDNDDDELEGEVGGLEEQDDDDDVDEEEES